MRETGLQPFQGPCPPGYLWTVREAGTSGWPIVRANPDHAALTDLTHHIGRHGTDFHSPHNQTSTGQGQDGVPKRATGRNLPN